MEVKEEQITNKFACCICTKSEELSSHHIIDNFIKYNESFVPFSEIIEHTVGFEVNFDDLSSVPLPEFKVFSAFQVSHDERSKGICELCKTKLIEFYYFKKRAEEVRENQTEFREVPVANLDLEESPLVYSTLQIVRNFIEKNSITEIKEEENENCLIIKPKKPKVTPTSFQASISIKHETSAVKFEPIEIKEDPDADLPFLQFIRSFGDSASNGSSEELTTSSEGSLSRLPAFQESTYFNGDKFVLRSEVPPKKLKEVKKRQKKPEDWATNIQKKLRNAGQRYRSAKGYIVEARQMGAPCTCRQQCGTKVNEKNRLNNFSSYWALGDIVRKRKFIFDHIKLERPMRAMTKSRAFSRLILHYLDVVNNDGTIERIKVCKTMFLSTLDISNTVITTTVKLNNQYFDDGEKRSKLSIKK